MFIKIKKWKGRFGNNIQQIVNALIVALYYDFNILIPKHDLFIKKEIIINKNNLKYLNKDKFEIIESNKLNNFFRIERIDLKNHKFNKKIFNNIDIDKIKLLIQSIFKINISKFKSLNQNVLVIYIRSGDIFDKRKKVNYKYVSAPFYFYKKVIDNYKYKYDEFYLVCEDTKNPIIRKILDTYKFIKYKKRNLEGDIKKLLRSHDLVSCYGSFIPGLLYLTNYIKNIYIPDYIDFNLYKKYKINIIKIELNNFFNNIKRWNNSQYQYDYLLKYKYKDKLNYTIKGKTDGFGAQYLSIITGIAWCNYNNHNYIHSKITQLEHNLNVEKMNEFMGIPENKNNDEIDIMEPYIYDVMYSSEPDKYYTEKTLNLIRNYYYSNKKIKIIDKKSIYIHIRRGDVDKNNKKRGNTNDFYLELIQKLKKKYKNYQIIIESEGNLNDFKELHNLNIQFNLNNNIEDTFQNFVSAQILVIAKSALSYCAALLNKNIVYYIPYRLKNLNRWKNIKSL